MADMIKEFEDKIKKQRELRQEVNVLGRTNCGGTIVSIGKDTGTLKRNLKRTTEEVIKDNKEAIELLAKM